MESEEDMSRRAFLKKIISFLLVTVMVMTACLPSQSYAAGSVAETMEDKTEPDAAETVKEIAEAVEQSGQFYVGSSSGKINEGESYVMRIARGGDNLPAASLRLAFVDITSKYGTDYTFRLLSDDRTDKESVGEEKPQDETVPGEEDKEETDVEQQVPDQDIRQSEDVPADSSLTDEDSLVLPDDEDKAETTGDETVEIGSDNDESVEIESPQDETVPDQPVKETDEIRSPEDSVPEEESISILDQVREDPDAVTEVDGLDLGSLSEEEQKEIIESEETELGEFVSRELQKYAEQDPDKYVFPTGNESQEPSLGGLSQIYTRSTGLTDDNMPMSSDGKAVLDINSLISGYTTDMLANAMDDLHSANMTIDFAEGETERFVEITALENDEAKGDLLFISAIFADSEDAVVSEFGSFTGEIIDNDAWEKPAIGFTKDKFTARDGYLTVKLKRDGTDTQFAAVKLSTTDGKARSGKDYSQVEAVVFFPAGIMERTVNIPVRGDYLKKKSDFTLTLSDATNCNLGDISEAVGWVGPDSGNYLEAEDNAGNKGGSDHASSALKGEAGSASEGGGTALKGETPSGGGNLVSVDISKNPRFEDYGDCSTKYDSDGYIYLMANGWDYDDCYAEFITYTIREDKRPVYAYSGLRLDYKKSGGGSSKTELILKDQGMKSLLDYTKKESSRDRADLDLFFTYENDKYIDYFNILTTHNGSPFSSRSKLYLYSLDLIPRPFELTASVKNGNDLKFVNEEGDLVGYEQANLSGVGSFTISGQNDKGISTKYVGDTVTVNTDATYTYIKALYLGDKKITADYPKGTSSVSFVMNEDFLKKYGSQAEYVTNGSKGRKGKFNIKVELGQYETEVKLNNDDERAKLTLEGNYQKDSEGNPVIHKGDQIRVKQTLMDAYNAAYKQSRIRFKTRETSAVKDNDDEKAFDPDYADTCVFKNVYAVINAYPIVEDKDNRIVVRIKDSDIAMFKAGEGIFKCESEISQAGYRDYIAVSQEDLQACVRYTLNAEPADENNVAVWKPAFKASRYSQNTFWFEADERAENNVLLLTCEKADSRPYSLKGKVYYSDVSLLTGVEGEAWIPATDVCVQITPIVYGLTDEEGTFRTMPMKGVEGCKVVYKVDSNSRTDYRTTTLISGNKETLNEAEVDSVDLGSFTVSSLNKEVPYLAAASLQSGESSNGTIAYIGGQEEGITNTFNIFVYNDNCKYIDNNGEEKVEKVIDVQLWAFDPLTNKADGRLDVNEEGESIARRIGPEGESNSIWQITTDLKEGEPNYKASDRLYVRVVTDRKKADAYDAEGNVIENSTFSTTTYPDINTGFVLSASDTAVPNTFDIAPVDIDLDLTDYIQLPIFNMMNCTCLLGQMAMSFQILPGNVHRFSIGRVLKENDFGNDTDQKFEGLGDAVTKIKKFSKDVKGTGKVGVKKGGGVYPFAGIYLDFAVSELSVTPSGGMALDLEPLGGGIYFGAQGKFRVTLYFPVAVPIYVGIDGALGGYATAGFHDTDTIKYHAVKNSEEDLNGHLDPDFTFKSEGWISGYGGVGLARVLGVRAGATFYGQFIYNPTITDIYPDFRTWGFKINLMLRLWLDAYFFQLPCPSYNWVERKWGYLKDMYDLLDPEKKSVKSSGVSDTSDASGNVLVKTVEEPSKWMPSKGFLKGSVTADGETILQNGGYDQASPQLLDMGEDGTLLVFLQGDASKAKGDQSTLSYSICRNGTWSRPAPIGNDETLSTGDFYPNLCDAGDSVMITWVSRRNESYGDNLEYLSQMDVYTCMFNKNTHAVTEVECLTKEGDQAQMATYDDENVVGLTNVAPVGIYDSNTGDRMVYYLKSEVKKEPGVDSAVYEGYSEESAQLLANLSPTQNKNFLVYMLYDNNPVTEDPDHPAEKGWARTHVYKNEASSKETRDYYIDQFGGQRMINIALHDDDFAVVNRPTVIDFNAISYNGLGVYAYTVDKDNSLDTEYDRELFLQVYDFEKHKTYHPIRITNDNVSDARPQLVRNVYNSFGDAHTWLFWLEGASVPTTDSDGKTVQESGTAAIRYIDIARLVSEGVNPDGSIGQTEQYQENSYEIAEEVRTLNYQSDNYNGNPTFGSYTAFVDKKNNLYVTWLQQPSRGDSIGTETEYKESVENSFGSQEIFATALIDLAEGRSWSDGVQLTHSGKANDGIAVAVDENNNLVTVGNQYTIGDDPADNLARDLSLVATSYKDVGSLEPVSVTYSDEKPQAGETVTASIMVRNTGLKAAEQGYEIKVYEVIDGVRSQDPVYTATGPDSVYAVSGSDPEEGGSQEREETRTILPGASLPVAFDWKLPDDFTGKKTLSLYAEVTEIGIGGDEATCSAELEGLKIEADYRFSNVEVVQEQDGFLLSCDITNLGNKSFRDKEVSLKAAFNDIYKTGGAEVWIDEPIDAIGPKESRHFSHKIRISDSLLTHGFANGYIDVIDKDGESAGMGTDFIAALEYPGRIVINGDEDLDTIELKMGESLKITGTYSPHDFYKGGTIGFSIDDGEIGHMEGSTLCADEVGTTTLRAFVVPYGGEKSITVNVLEASEKEKADAEKTQGVIDKLPAAGSVTLDDYEKIEAARKAYDALSPAAKALVDASSLKAAEEKLESLKIDISKTTITGIKTKTYTGKALQQSLTITYKGKTLVKGKDYTVRYKNNIKAGKASLLIQGIRTCKGSITKTFTIKKAANKLTVKGKTVKIKYKKLKKKAKVFTRKKVLKVSRTIGKVTYTRVKGNKKIKINKKTGKVTVKKGLKKGTYTVNVKVKAAGDANHKAITRKAKFKVKVK